jgi:DNA primase
VVFCFDGDNAGRQAAWRALKIVLPTLQDGRESRYLFLAEGEDPDSLIRSTGKDGFIAQLQTALPAADFLFKQLIGDSDLQSIGSRTRLAETAKPLIKSIPGNIYRTLLYQQLSELVGTSIVDSALPGQVVTQRRREPAYKVHRNAMRTAIILALQHPSVIKSEELDRYDFDETQAGGYVLQKLIGIVLGNPDISTAGLLENFRDAGEWDYLRQLAATEIPNLYEDDTILASRLFSDSVDQLASASRRRSGVALRERADTGAFDDELKAKLRAHLPYEE